MEIDNKILEKAKAQVDSSFTKEIIENCFIPANRNHFGVFVVNVRGGEEIHLEYTFTRKTGKMVKYKRVN